MTRLDDNWLQGWTAKRSGSTGTIRRLHPFYLIKSSIEMHSIFFYLSGEFHPKFKKLICTRQYEQFVSAQEYGQFVYYIYM